MKITVQRETLLKSLQLVAGVVERRQTLPILANVLLKAKGKVLTITGTDLEVELQARATLENSGENGEITVPARKLMDICRSLAEGDVIELSYDDPKLHIRSGRSRFSLATLPAKDFPNADDVPGEFEFSLPQQELRLLIERTQLAMAQQDVRYYLNGMLWEIDNQELRCISTDGHRLAKSYLSADKNLGNLQVIVPRKAVLELARLLATDDASVDVALSSNSLRIKTTDFTFVTKLIDAKYPDYNKVIPKKGDKILVIERDELKAALNRVAVLANEKHRSVRVELRQDQVRLVTNNPEQEQAEEELTTEYKGENLDIGFNVGYLVDAISALPNGKIQLTFSNADSSVLIQSVAFSHSLYVVMPMRL